MSRHLSRRGWKRLSTLIHAFCCERNEIAAEEQLKFHFWARLIFSMVVSRKILSAGVKTEEKCAAMCNVFLEKVLMKKLNKSWTKSWRKTLPEAQRTQGIESITWIIFLAEISLKIFWPKSSLGPSLETICDLESAVQCFGLLEYTLRCASGNVFLQLVLNFFLSKFSQLFRNLFQLF